LSQIAKPGYKLIKSRFGKHLEIPNDWNYLKIGKFSKIISGEYFAYSDFVDSGIPVLKIDNVMHGKIDWTNITYVPKEFLKKHKEMVLKNGDIVLALNRPITHNLVKVARLFDSDVPSMLYQRVGKFQIENNKKMTETFLYFFLNSPYFKQIIFRILIGTDQPYVKTTELLRQDFGFPNEIKEQKNIASILSNTDSQIQQTRKIIEHAQKLKQGLMQKLLTKGIGHTNFQNVKDFFKKQFKISKKWDYPKFSSVVKVNPGTKVNSEFASYVPMDAVNTDSMKVDYFEKRRVRDHNGLPRFLENDVLFARITPSTENGKTALMENFKGVGIASSELTVLRPGPKVLPRYLFYYVKSHRIRQFAISQMLGTTNRQRVPEYVFEKDLNFELPPIKEQKKIVSILSNIDSQITEKKKIHSKLIQLKRGQMQKLLTGQIRVTQN